MLRPPYSFHVRAGDVGDLGALLPLFDRAVSWLVARGQAGQWGTTPFSASTAMVEHLNAIVQRGALRVAIEGRERIAGCCVVGPAPAYAPPVDAPDRYLLAMVTDRELAGHRIGALLVDDAAELARAAGAQVLRTDCWAEAQGLVHWYERQGFWRDGVVLVGSWPAQMLRRAL